MTRALGATLLAAAAALPLGRAREDAYGELDAPAIPWAALNNIQFVAPRVGCVTFTPLFDLTAICLR